MTVSPAAPRDADPKRDGATVPDQGRQRVAVAAEAFAGRGRFVEIRKLASGGHDSHQRAPMNRDHGTPERGERADIRRPDEVAS